MPSFASETKVLGKTQATI